MFRRKHSHGQTAISLNGSLELASKTNPRRRRHMRIDKASIMDRDRGSPFQRRRMGTDTEVISTAIGSDVAEAEKAFHCSTEPTTTADGNGPALVSDVNQRRPCIKPDPWVADTTTTGRDEEAVEGH